MNMYSNGQVLLAQETYALHTFLFTSMFRLALTFRTLRTMINS